jgi:hypothetical protein
MNDAGWREHLFLAHVYNYMNDTGWCGHLILAHGYLILAHVYN